MRGFNGWPFTMKYYRFLLSVYPDSLRSIQKADSTGYGRREGGEVVISLKLEEVVRQN